MDSRRWLVALAALATLFGAILVAIEIRRPSGASGGRLVPELDPHAVQAVHIRRAGSADLSLDRAGGPWRLRAPVDAPADQAAVLDLLGAVELLSARRRGPGRIEQPALAVRIERAAGPIELAFGKGGGATDRVWVQVSGTGGLALVDGHLVRDLMVAPEALRDRRVLASDGPFDRIEIASTAGADPVELRVQGSAWLLDRVRADPDRVSALLERLARLRVGRFLPERAAPGEELRVALHSPEGTAELGFGGPCPGGPGQVELRSQAGHGCVAAAERTVFEDILAAPETLRDRRLVPVAIDEVTRVRLIAGDLEQTADRAGQAQALRDWLRQFRDLPTGELVPADRLTPLGAVEIEAGDEEHLERVEIARTGSGRIVARRPDEPVALALGRGALELVTPGPHRFRSLDLLAYDPTALQRATARRGAVAAEAIERGELLEEWTARVPPGAAVDPSAIERLVDAASNLRAQRADSPRAEPRHRLTPPRRTIDLVFDPPPGSAPDAPAVRHTIELGAATEPGGCFARLAGDPVVFELAAQACAALTATWLR